MRLPAVPLRRLLATAVVAVLPFASPAAWASATATDQGDLWYNASESGWGMQLSHHGSTIFVTVYAYDAANKPTWFVAQLAPAGAGWSGDVFVTTGPSYAAPAFDPTAVTVRKAGTMTWTPDPSGTSASVTYTVDGTTVTKNVVRQGIGNEDYSGQYRGVISFTNSCRGFSQNVVDVVVTQGGTSVSVNWANLDTRDTCSFVGLLKQDGALGSINGEFECRPVHDDGKFQFTEMRVTPYSLSGRYHSLDPDTKCETDGTLAAGRWK